MKLQSCALFLVGIICNVRCTHHHVDLQGSEADAGEVQIKTTFHKPLLSHMVSPFLHQHWQWHHKRPAPEPLPLPPVRPIKPCITSTRTLLLQTIRHQVKHYACYRAAHDLPPCLPDCKDQHSYIRPTAVPEYSRGRQTQVLGYIESGELKRDDEYNLKEDIDREQRQLYGHDFFTSVKYETHTLWVTKVEDYINTQVTATLIAANCVPSNPDIPPCPEKVEHYVHYDLSHEGTPVWERKFKQSDDQKGISRENSKEFDIQSRSGKSLDSGDPGKNNTL